MQKFYQIASALIYRAIRAFVVVMACVGVYLVILLAAHLSGR